MKSTGVATDWMEIDQFDGNVGWIAYPDEVMQRASHALVVDSSGSAASDLWLVDPVDADGLDDYLAEHGEVAGVAVLLDRHKRDAETIARRHDVSVWVPSFMDGVAGDIGAPVERFQYELDDTGFAAHKVVNNRFWQEALLYNEDEKILVIPEAVGTTEYFTAGEEPLGVHPALRLKPPTTLARLDPEHTLVGHGAGIHDDAAAILEDTVRNARARTPGLYWQNLKMLLPT